MKNTAKLIIASTLMLCLMLALASCSLIEDKGTYEMGNDSIISVKSVLGEMGARKMTSFNISINNGVQTNIYTYTTDPNDAKQAANDMAKYFQFICDNEGFLSMVTFDGLPYEGGVEMRFGKNSVDEGKIIILEIEYDTKGYTLTFTKCEGSLTPRDGDI